MGSNEWIIRRGDTETRMEVIVGAYCGAGCTRRSDLISQCAVSSPRLELPSRCNNRAGRNALVALSEHVPRDQWKYALTYRKRAARWVYHTRRRMIKARDSYPPDLNYHSVPRNEGSYMRVNIDVEERRKVAYYRGFESENQFPTSLPPIIFRFSFPDDARHRNNYDYYYYERKRHVARYVNKENLKIVHVVRTTYNSEFYRTTLTISHNVFRFCR